MCGTLKLSKITTFVLPKIYIFYFIYYFYSQASVIDHVMSKRNQIYKVVNTNL